MLAKLLNMIAWNDMLWTARLVGRLYEKGYSPEEAVDIAFECIWFRQAVRQYFVPSVILYTLLIF